MFTNNIKKVYREFPRSFWSLILATFIDRLGGFLLFPFFALYVTEHFQVGMTQVGILLTIFSATNIAGSMVGGALTDKLGRRWMLIFGLVASAVSSIVMGLVNDLGIFYVVVALVGLLSNTGGPAQQAMIADLLPEEKRAEGYGIFRVAFNVSATIGPAIGGLLASYSFLLLFISDAFTSLVTAVMVYAVLPETKPETPEDQAEESMSQTLRGYRKVLRDGVYMAFIGVFTLMSLVYVQMNSTLSVYLRDVHDISPESFGYILSLNAAMVVLFQFWVTRRVIGYAPMIVLVVGGLFYAVGFAMYGFVSLYSLFLVAMVIITIGEMVVAPVAQALVAQFAPEDMRGRYMAMFGFTWGISFALGPILAGLVIDNYDPNWVWYGSGLLGLVAVLGFLWLHLRVGHRFELTEKELETAAPVIAES